MRCSAESALPLELAPMNASMTGCWDSVVYGRGMVLADGAWRGRKLCGRGAWWLGGEKTAWLPGCTAVARRFGARGHVLGMGAVFWGQKFNVGRIREACWKNTVDSL